jgi:hypothetical protein
MLLVAKFLDALEYGMLLHTVYNLTVTKIIDHDNDVQR